MSLVLINPQYGMKVGLIFKVSNILYDRSTDQSEWTSELTESNSAIYPGVYWLNVTLTGGREGKSVIGELGARLQTHKNIYSILKSFVSLLHSKLLIFLAFSGIMS